MNQIKEAMKAQEDSFVDILGQVFSDKNLVLNETERKVLRTVGKVIHNHGFMAGGKHFG